MIEISNPGVILTAFKPGADRTVVVRFYESAGLPAKGVAIHINAALLSAHESNLMEDAGKALAISNNTLKLDLKPFEIKTIKLKIADLQVNAIRAAQ
jgi:alpha-mannosidase